MEAVNLDYSMSGLSAMLLPLQTDHLILPEVMVAEIRPAVEVQTQAGSPDWFIGYIDWKGHDLPLISFEALNGAMPIPAESVKRVAIIKTMADHGHLHYYAVAIDDVPDIVDVAGDTVSMHEGRPRGRAEVMSIACGDRTAGIPNLDWVEQHILTYILHS